MTTLFCFLLCTSINKLTIFGFTFSFCANNLFLFGFFVGWLLFLIAKKKRSKRRVYLRSVLPIFRLPENKCLGFMQPMLRSVSPTRDSLLRNLRCDFFDMSRTLAAMAESRTPDLSRGTRELLRTRPSESSRALFTGLCDSLRDTLRL